MGAWTRGIAAAAMFLGGGVAWARGPSLAPAEPNPAESTAEPSPRPETVTCFWGPPVQTCPFGSDQDPVLQQIQIAESSQGTLRNSDPAGCWMPGQTLNVTRSTDYDAGG